MDDPQAGVLDRPIWQFGLRRLRALHHLVSGRDRYNRGGGRDSRFLVPITGAISRGGGMKGLEGIVLEHPFFAGLGPEFGGAISGCARNLRFTSGEYLFREDEPAHEFYLL